MAERCLFPALPKPRSRFFAALLQTIFPQRPVVIVAGDLKTQESFPAGFGNLAGRVAAVLSGMGNLSRI
jgi:hypothetical protein